MWSVKKDSNSAELATMRTSSGPMTVMTANGEVRTNKEATVYVKQLDLFVTVMLLQGTPAVLSLGKLCEEHGYTYQRKSGLLSTICGSAFIYLIIIIIITGFSV